MEQNTIDADFLAIVEHLEGPKCKSVHRGADNARCTQTVVAMKYTCRHPEGFGICAASLMWNVRVMAGHIYCETCMRPAEDCWTVEPL